MVGGKRESPPHATPQESTPLCFSEPSFLVTGLTMTIHLSHPDQALPRVVLFFNIDMLAGVPAKCLGTKLFTDMLKYHPFNHRP